MFRKVCYNDCRTLSGLDFDNFLIRLCVLRAVRSCKIARLFLLIYKIFSKTLKLKINFNNRYVNSTKLDCQTTICNYFQLNI